MFYSIEFYSILCAAQVSPAGCPQERPEWSHSFLFLGRDCATVFTGGAALVMELYPTTTGAAQHSTAQHSTAQPSTAQPSTAQPSTAQPNTQPSTAGIV